MKQKMVFDVKGSVHHRTVRFNEKWWMKKAAFEGHKKVMKCRNFVQINEDYYKTLVEMSEDKITQLQDIV
jgi:hypothetical protein